MMADRPSAFVTGGASGIGRAAVRRLVARGFHVAAADVSDDALCAIEEELPGKVTGYRVDVSDGDAMADVLAKVEDAHGPLAHVLACAGVARVGPTLDVTLADVRLMANVNYLGAVNTVYAALPRMLDRGAGELAVIASATGLLPPRKMAAYGATKAAVVSFMQSLRYETVSTGVKVAVVCPAAVATPMAQDFFADPGKRAKSMAITPEKVVEATEKGLAKGTFLIIPGSVGRGTVALNRFFPGAMRRLQSLDRFDLV